MMIDGERAVFELGIRFREYADALRARRRTSDMFVMRLDHVREWLRARKEKTAYGQYGRGWLETPEKISKLLRSNCGLHIARKQFKEGGLKFRVVADRPISEDNTWEELRPFLLTPDKITCADSCDPFQVERGFNVSG